MLIDLSLDLQSGHTSFIFISMEYTSIRPSGGDFFEEHRACWPSCCKNNNNKIYKQDRSVGDVLRQSRPLVKILTYKFCTMAEGANIGCNF